MTPQELKNSIIRCAIQGKLVEQRSEEGTAKELLDKHNISFVTGHDSFDIPDTWCWVLLQDIATFLYGFPFNSEQFNDTRIGMPIIRIRDIINGYSKTYSDEECDERYRIKRGDMLIGMDGNFQVSFWNSEDGWLNQRVCKISTVDTILNQSFLFYYLPIVLAEINGTVSFSTVKHLSAKILNAMAIPVPPLAEQKRIVAKIEELLPLIDRYEEAWTKLEDFNKRFPGDMQRSILQMAIQGKLVEQHPEEGTGEELYKQIQAEKAKLIKAGKLKKEKPLPEITEDAIPFDIPDNWKWVPLGFLADINGGYAFKSIAYSPDGVRVVRISDFNENGFLDSKIVRHPYSAEYKPFLLEEKNILLCMTGGTVGKSYLVKKLNEIMMVNQRVATIKIKVAMPEYINYNILAPIIQAIIQHSKNSTNDNISMETIKTFPIPLPPLAEQKRIVAKIEEVLPLCEMLK